MPRNPAMPFHTPPLGEWFVVRVNSIPTAGQYTFTEQWLDGTGTWIEKIGGRIATVDNPGISLIGSFSDGGCDLAFARSAPGAGGNLWEMLPIGGGCGCSSPILVNGDFGTGAISPWVPAGSIVAGVNSDHPHCGLYDASFLGSGTSSGTLTQVAPVLSGGTYTLTFWLANFGDPGGASELLVKVDGTTILTLTDTDTPDGPWTKYTAIFTAASTTATLEFGATPNSTSIMYLAEVEIDGPPPLPLFTPSFTGLTETGGAVAKNGQFTLIADRVEGEVTITPVTFPATSTSAVAGTSYFDAPVPVGRNSAAVWVIDTSTHLPIGQGSVDASTGRIYVPTWTTIANAVVVSFAYGR